MRLLNFLQYNNAVPIAISVLVLGAGSTFAATNPDAIYSQTESVVSIDNSYIANKNLDAYSPQAQITNVTEDSENYYVAYRFSTIDLKDGVWQDVVYDKTMTIAKDFLGAYRDLGVYVTEQLKENVDSELARLRGTQEIERKNVTQKVVATTYGGLVGKMLDTTTETLPGYTPVIAEPVAQLATAMVPDTTSGTNDSGATGSTNSAPSSAQIGLQLLGNNPAVIPLRTSYSDLGAVLIDPNHQNVGIHVFQNGAEVASPTVDTSTTSVATIEYRATDHGGVTVMVRRVILVGGAEDPGGEITSAGATEITNPQPAPTPTPAPAPTPSSTPAPSPTPTETTATTSASTTATSTSDSSSTTTPPTATTTTSTSSSTNTASTSTSAGTEPATASSSVSVETASTTTTTTDAPPVAAASSTPEL